MAVRTGLWVNSRVDTADARAGVFGLLTSEGANSLFRARSGVLLDTDYPLAVGTAAGVNDVSVNAGVAVFGRTGMVGAYTVANDSGFTLTLPAPPATDKRIDSVWIGQPDVDAGDASSVEVISFTSSAVSATPTAPAVPAYAVRLADVTRTAGDTAITSGMIADKRVWTVPRRAIGHVPSTDLATVRSKARDGEINWAPDKGAHYTVSGAGEGGGGTWEPLVNLSLTGRGGALVGGSAPAVGTGLFKVQAGSHVVTTASSGAFDIALPSAYPGGVITATVVAGDNTEPFFCSTIQATSSATTLKCVAYDAAGIGLISKTIRVNWIAIGW